MTEREKMLSGELYDSSDNELEQLRLHARKLARRYNLTDEDQQEVQAQILRELLPATEELPYLQAPVYFDYGCHTYFGKYSSANFNFTCLDVGEIHIGDNVMIGPNVTLATPMHPLLPEERNVRKREDGSLYTLEYAKPITIKDNCWLDAPFLQSVFEVAEELKLPVLFHMSPKEGFQYGVVDGPGLPLLEENLKRYKGLKFIGHSQPFWHEISKDAPATPKERMKWGEGAVCPGGRLPYLFETYENLYGDLSANSGGCAIMRDEEFGLAFLEKYQDRLLFGTDMANCEMTFPLGNWLDEQEHAGRLSRSAYEKICRTNAEKLFHL